MKLIKILEGTRTDALIIAILIFYGFYTHPYFNLWTILSIFCFTTGAGLGLMARHQLGKAFSVKPKATILVKHGVYAKIRHPIYFAGMIINLGFCFLYQHWIIYTITFLLLFLQIFRATKEEKILTKAFGQEYLDYKKSTWF
jgi:protein-S-isoprenylcysteine O-methyltransferase Ste14